MIPTGQRPGQHREQVQAAVGRGVHGREIETSRSRETCCTQQRATVAGRTVEDRHVAVHELERVREDNLTFCNFVTVIDILHQNG